jgi:uncharacterized heparinase superfamily protein
MIQDIAQYWHTVRHLKPVQYYGQLRHLLPDGRPDARPAPAPRLRAGPWRAIPSRAPALLGPTRFSFIGETYDLETIGWDSPACGKLWRYNLHYFDDLNAAGAADRTAWHLALLDRWLAENPPARGTAWEPYPTSLRIVNWIKWGLAGHELPAPLLLSLAVQARWLARHLEWRLLGNHLLANAKALVFAGTFFDGPEAGRWLALGLSVYRQQLKEQILADGGHFERSPMYHAIILEDLLDLVNLDAAYAEPGPLRPAAGSWRDCVRRMRAWLAAMVHPDAEISFFNDAAFGIAPSPEELDRYAIRLGLGETAAPRDGIIHLAPSGYIRVQAADMVAILDVALVGPDYLPGHAHADTLAFELSLFGQRVIVNSGTSSYVPGPERNRQRSTAAHNTLVVDGCDSSEVWGAFRVARRANPFDLAQSGTPERMEVACSHDGYRRLPGRVVHRRSWAFETRSLTVTDRLEGRWQRALGYFHLHPGIDPVADERGMGLMLPNQKRLTCVLDGGPAEIAADHWHPRFGLSQPSRAIVLDLQGEQSSVRFSW